MTYFYRIKTAPKVNSFPLLAGWACDLRTLDKSRWNSGEPFHFESSHDLNKPLPTLMFTMFSFATCWHSTSQFAPFLHTTSTHPHQRLHTKKGCYTGKSVPSMVTVYTSQNFGRFFKNSGTFVPFSFYPCLLSLASSTVHSAVQSGTKSAGAVSGVVYKLSSEPLLTKWGYTWLHWLGIPCTQYMTPVCILLIVEQKSFTTSALLNCTSIYFLRDE